MSEMKRIVELAQIAMTGELVPIQKPVEADLIATYVANELLGVDRQFDFASRVNQYNGSKTPNEIVGLAVKYVYDMVIVNLVLENKSRGDYRIKPFEFKSGDFYYTLCWAENLNVDYYSELGDVAFTRDSETGEYLVA